VIGSQSPRLPLARDAGRVELPPDLQRAGVPPCRGECRLTLDASSGAGQRGGMKRVTMLLLAMVIAASNWWLVLIPTTASYQLPTTNQTGCMGIGLTGVSLYGSPDYPRVAWIGTPGSVRIDVVWPAGFSARFEPDLEVLDAAGRLFAREGSRVTGACLTDDPRVKFLDYSSFSADPTT
jgi:hypothetical protein